MKRQLLLAGSALSVATAALQGIDPSDGSPSRARDLRHVGNGRPHKGPNSSGVGAMKGPLTSKTSKVPNGGDDGPSPPPQPPKTGGKSGKQTKPTKAKGEEPAKSKSRKAPTKKDGKSGKSSKEHHDEVHYYLAPFPCANECVDADGVDFGTGLLTDAVRPCSVDQDDVASGTQRWIVHESNDMVKVESAAYRNRCIAVDYLPGDGAKEVSKSCSNGSLALLPCEDPAASFYFTGGRLLSFFCWSSVGVSASMGVTYDVRKGTCGGELIAADSPAAGLGAGVGIVPYVDPPSTRKLAVHEPPSSGSVAVGATFMFVSSEEMEALYNPLPHEDGDPTMSPTLSPTSSPTYYPTTSPTLLPTISDEPTIVSEPTTPEPTTPLPTLNPTLE